MERRNKRDLKALLHYCVTNGSPMLQTEVKAKWTLTAIRPLKPSQSIERRALIFTAQKVQSLDPFFSEKIFLVTYLDSDPEWICLCGGDLTFHLLICTQKRILYFTPSSISFISCTFTGLFYFILVFPLSFGARFEPRVLLSESEMQTTMPPLRPLRPKFSYEHTIDWKSKC